MQRVEVLRDTHWWYMDERVQEVLNGRSSAVRQCGVDLCLVPVPTCSTSTSRPRRLAVRRPSMHIYLLYYPVALTASREHNKKRTTMNQSSSTFGRC